VQGEQIEQDHRHNPTSPSAFVEDGLNALVAIPGHSLSIEDGSIHGPR
jgi:hypothetical protein